MLLENLGVDDASSKGLMDLFDDDIQQEPPLADDDTSPNDDGKLVEQVDQTKAFAKRLRESTDKARAEEREAIAKTLGFNSYEELQKSKERKVIEEKGFDPDELSPILEQLVQQRLDNDPRMRELETLKARQIEEFGKRELEEISKLTGGEITTLEQVPADVIDLWKKKGSLKKAYLELKGEELIMKTRSGQNKGSTAHLNSPSGNVAPAKTVRPLTAEEKKIWKFFNPTMTEEELNNKTVEK